MSDALADQVAFAPATALAARIRQREVSPVEVLEGVLARVERVEPAVHAFVTLDADRARAAARAAEAAVLAGDTLGLLHGLPVSIKDLEPTAGLRTTYGSRFFEHHVPDEDGGAAARVRAAGGIIFGKTNTPHFGHKDMSDNLIGPATRNPWGLDRTSGGSSGGAAASVAAGAGPLAHGSDGAGSIRIPAALCGVVGLKPTLGRVPYWPNPDFWAARSHNGPIARTVRDAALLLTAMAGYDERDAVSLNLPAEDFVAACDGGVAGLRVAWSPDFGYAAVDPQVRRLTEAAARRFEDLGAHVEEATPPWSDPAPWASLLWYASFAARNEQRAAEHPEWIEPSMRAQMEAGLRATALEVGRAHLARTAFYEQARAFMAPFDLLLTPQMPCTAWSLDGWPTRIGDRPVEGMFDHLPFTFPFNQTGWPAASVPCGFDAAGLPVALQVVGKRFQDALVLRAAAAYEAAEPWAHHRPPL